MKVLAYINILLSAAHLGIFIYSLSPPNLIAGLFSGYAAISLLKDLEGKC